MSSTREHLLGYLLGALEPAEMAAVERELENNPRLRKDLAAIEAAMTPLGFPDREDDVDYAGPPLGLADRTCDFIDDAATDVIPKPMPASVGRSHASTTSGDAVGLRPTGRSLRRSDVIVTASVLLAAVSLLFPAIWSSRQAAQITACQNNLKSLGLSLAEYAGRSADGRIPLIPASGNRSNAGFYASLLHDRQLLTEPGLLICPSSELAQQRAAFRIPSLAEIDRAKGEGLVRLQRVMGGSYAYNMGYVEDGLHCAPKHEHRAHYALMSDAPAAFPERQTKNHRSCGQNILYEDNSVRFVVNPCDELCDDPYLNRSGLVAAGLDCADVVLGESPAKPNVVFVLSTH
jgi:hypothetical protein